MTPEEIKKQMMGSAGIKDDDADTLFNNAVAAEDEDSTFQLARKAAEMGHTGAQSLLAMCYLHGCGVQMDAQSALVYFEKAAGAGDATAMLEMAKCYARGLGIDQNPSKALELARSAREKGLEAAAELVAELENEIEGRKPEPRSMTSVTSFQSTAPQESAGRAKSIVVAIVLAVIFGPFGLFYLSWKRALVMLFVFILGVSLIPNNGFVALLLWLVAPALSIIALGVGPRQTPPA
jgi:hypothetical protein